MQGTAIRKGTLTISLLSILPHIFCCGIPAIVALISLGTTVGLGVALASNPFYSFVDTYHTELLIVAVAGVTLSGIFNFIAYRMDCRKAEHACTHAACAPKKLKSFRIFLLSLALLVLDLAWFATEEYVLGLHHHGHAAEQHAEEHHNEHNSHSH